MLSNVPGKKRNTAVEDYVLFDLETTGISCVKDRVVEISAVKVAGGEVIEEFSTLVNPGMHIPGPASRVNGITDDMVADSPFFEEAFGDFLEFVGDAVLVGHNIRCFDLKFLYRDALEFWGKTLGNDYVDTLDVSRACLPGMRHHTLTDLAEHYGISTEGAHRALNDCRMNQKVYELLKQEKRQPSETSGTGKICPVCGNEMKKRSGKFGTFWGCSSYPGCRYTENI
jgi:DNA polymerase III epsilon subunit family exonuclease